MRTALTKSLLFAALLCLFQFAYSQDWSEIGQTFPESPALSVADEFGTSVDIDGQYYIVGAPYDSENGSSAGAAYVYYQGTLQAKLLPSNPIAGDRFGYSVAISGDYAVVGSPYSDPNGSTSGSFYVFKRSGTTWTETFQYTAGREGSREGWSVDMDGDWIISGAPYYTLGTSGDGRATFFKRDAEDWVNEGSFTRSQSGSVNLYGYSVAIQDGQAFVGAPNDDEDADGVETGAVYAFKVFANNEGWSQYGRFTASDAADNDDFGRSVTAHTGRFIVGAPYDDDNGSASGSVYVFIGANDTWYQDNKLTASDAAGGDYFGWSVNAYANQLLIGAPNRNNETGAVYYFTNTTGDFTQANIITADDASENAYYGYSVAIPKFGSRMVVGAHNDNSAGALAGSAYYTTRSGDNWPLHTKQTPLPFAVSEEEFEYGYAVSADGNIAVVGAHDASFDVNYGQRAGYVYVLEKSQSSWSTIALLSASDASSSSDFGVSVDIEGDVIVVGALQSDAGSNDAGAAYVFEKPAGGWEDMTETAVLTASNAASNDQFGSSVSISGDYIAVGAPSAEPAVGSSQGSVYVFEKSGANWTDMNETVELVHPDPTDSDYFGSSVSIDNDQLLIGVYGDDDLGSLTGSAFIFERTTGNWAQSAKLLPSSTSTSARFGWSAALKNGVAIIGAYGNETAHIFIEPVTGWTTTSTEDAILSSSDDASNFGRSVDLQDELVVVGASSANAVYLFRKPEGGWMTSTETEILTDPTVVSGDFFGGAVATTGIDVVVGAYGNSDAGTDAGSAFFFEEHIAPSDISLSANSLDENLTSGTSIGSLTSTDVNFLETHTYSIGGTDAASFSIGGDNNDELLSTTEFDFEMKNTFEIEITTTDNSGLFRTEIFTISVNDVSENPTDLSLSGSYAGAGDVETVDILQNQAIGSAIGIFTTADQDNGATHTLEISGTDAAKFQLGGAGNKELQNAEIFLAEATYTITVTATDNDDLEYTEDFIIEVLPNQTPTDIGLDETTVVENNATSTLVGTLTTVDADLADEHSYTISGADASSFTLGGTNDDELYTTETFDFETKDSYEITITTDDGLGGTYDEDFIISVINENDNAPTDITIDSDNVDENLPPFTVIGTFSTTDGDAEDSFTYSISGTDEIYFEIDGSDLITLDAYDYEGKSTFSIDITTSDAGDLEFTKTFTINLNDVNDRPNNIELSNETIQENLPSGTLIGSMTTSDQDVTDTHTYSILGDDASFFQIGGTNNDELQNTTSFDLESIGSYVITIASDDGNGGTLEKEFTITITNENEAPTFIDRSDNEFYENDPIGTLIGELSTTDVDEGDTHSYTLGGDDAEFFQLTGDNNQEIRTNSVFNFETAGRTEYTINVTSTDAGGLSTSSDIILELFDVNEAPTGLTLSSSTVNENEAAPIVIGTFTTTDEDFEDAHTVTISGGTDANAFEMDGDDLVAVQSFDFETKSELSIEITTTDDLGGLMYTETFTILVQDINDDPDGISLSTSEIVANRPVGTLVGIITTSDQDAGDSHTYSIKSGADSDNFQISGDELLTAVVIDGTQSSYDITLVTTDSEGETFGDSFTITVIPNNAPTALSLSNTLIESGLDVGSVVGDLSTTDADESDMFSYAISGTDAASFKIGGDNNDELQVAEKLFYTVQPSYDITITSTDLSGATVSDDFTIEVTAVLGSEIKEQIVSTYPNPSDGRFTIETSEDWIGASINLVDINGSAMKLSTSTVSQNLTEVSANLNSGIYFMILRKGEEETVKKILIH